MSDLQLINPFSRSQCMGWVKYTIDYDTGERTQGIIRNTVLATGKSTLANVLANLTIESNSYISQMIFGTNGTVNNVPKFVEDSRTGLFGPTLLSKNVIASVDPAAPTTVTFTSVVAFNEAVGFVLSEMALQMNGGQLYSMITFPDLSKTSSMQLTYDWAVTFL